MSGVDAGQVAELAERYADAEPAAFDVGTDASRAAVGIHRSLARADWPGPRLDVRIGLHAGPAELRSGDYFGPTVNAASRIAAAAHGGQTMMVQPLETTKSIISFIVGSKGLR